MRILPDETPAVVPVAEPGAGDGPERSCILTRGRAPQAALVRLVLAPDGRVLPDVRAKAPGRGAWIGVTRAELEAAGKRLRGALARAFKTGELSVPDDLPALIAAALERNALDRLGLEARAGTLLTGSERIEQAARAGQVRALYHAADASADGARRLAQAWRVGSDDEGSGRQGLALPVDRPILSMALGRENVVHIAVVDRAAAARVGEALNRWLHFIGPDRGSPRRDGSSGPDRGSARGDTLKGSVPPVPCETASQGATASDFPGDQTGRDDN